ncbi:fatty acid synthase-like [Culicoides brevitarsis]|uniref:fatty acid synthase-like n=1 Tax=Culicoides brevitarsis TaxID=469753 RepID=UPI00307B16AF
MSREAKKPKFYSRTTPLTPGDQVVISGISGRYPNSYNIKEFAHRLYNKIDCIDDAETRWLHKNAEIPKRMGKIDGLEKFDANFFGVHFKQAHCMDPQCRVLVEMAYQAVLDAGINPQTIRGSRTGVFMGACFAESEKTWFYEKVSAGGYGITGCSRAMLANRISFTMDLEGPSFLTDTACSSSMYALDCAFSALMSGECDAALVGGANLLLHPYVTLQFARLGVLAPDGYCRAFDADASGYTRSEAISVIFLQKAKDAKRVYGSLLYSKANNDGYKEEGITYPAGKMQQKLLNEFYDDLGVDPSTVDYVEAHCTGTKAGDPEECDALDKVFCVGRKEPLLVGSVKSNMGHSESTSGVCSITKCILAMETELIPPNIHFKRIRPGITALEEGRLKVVDEVTPLPGDLIAVNSFGFGGGNAHALLRANPKRKINHGAPLDDLPRLIVWSGRTEDAVNTVLDDFETRPLDAEYCALIHSTQSSSVPALVWKGYGLYSHKEGENALRLSREVQYHSGLKRPIVFIFSGMGSQWIGMGTDLMRIPIFRKAIDLCQKVLEPKGLDVIKIITSTDPSTFDNILHSFVGIAAIQIGLVDILNALNIVPDYIIGHSVGELGCGYADGCFTAEQMILSAYSRGMASIESNVIHGTMAAVALGYKKIVKMLPPGIEVACHNSSTSCTLSGPTDLIVNYVKQLTDQKIFARTVQTSNIPYHSSYIKEMGPKLLARLNEVIPNPKKRSAKWLSSSVPKSQWDKVESQYCSAEYHTNNLLSHVLFEETSALLPSNALTIEIAPHGLMQAILKRSMPTGVHVGLTQRGSEENTKYFINALGKLFINGIDLPLEKLYPAIEYPVSRGTPMISHLIKWDHSEDWFVTRYDTVKRHISGEKVFRVSLQDQDYFYISGHCIDSRVLFPATAYLFLVWDTLAMMTKRWYVEVEVEFSDVKFLRATNMSNDDIDFIVMIQHGTGRFEIAEGKTALVTGYIREVNNPKLAEIEPEIDSTYPVMPTRDFYKELRLRGYHYKDLFRQVIEARGDGSGGKVKWEDNWVAFMDCLLQISIVGKDSRALMLPTGIERMTISNKIHNQMLKEMDLENAVFEIQSSKSLNIVRSGGVEIKGIQVMPVSRRRPPGDPVLERYVFMPHLPSPKLTKENAMRVIVQLGLENSQMTTVVKAVEVDGGENFNPVIDEMFFALGDLPLMTPDLTFLTSRTPEINNIKIENAEISSQSGLMFAIVTNLLRNEEKLNVIKKSLSEKGFILCRETSRVQISDLPKFKEFQILSVIPLDDQTYVLLQVKPKVAESQASIVKVSSQDTEYLWVGELQNLMSKNKAVIVVSEESHSGVIGLVNCIRKEPKGQNVSCVFVDDPTASKFDVDNPMYKNQLQLGLAINVFKDGQWGSYRHLQLITERQTIQRRDHCYANTLTKADISSLSWLTGPYNYTRPKNELARVRYASLNFRDVMLASGKLNAEVLDSGRLDQECVLGFEYSGIAESGRRIMGMVISGAMATYVETDDTLTWEAPSHWTLEQAATIPVVYGTVYSAFFITAKIQKGKKILIHAGTGGVGLAAIRVALAYGLDVFTTVSTEEKKRYLLETYPQLKENQIGNSRNTSFEDMIMTITKGRGVDFVLNSLSEDKLQASIRCLGKGGKFLEIGKFDMANDSKIGLGNFLKEISFHAVLVDNLFRADLEQKRYLYEIVNADIRNGIVQPLKTTIFDANDVEQAFRYLASGKHMGKVLLKVREKDDDLTTLPITVTPRAYFDPKLTYIICGGLGGFGLELADWLVIRGARKLMLSSSRGITKPYQSYRIRIWESYGVKVGISTADITTREGCEQLMMESIKIGHVGGIFNLAVQLRDSIFENQDVTKFKECMAPKAVATKFLDEVSRKMCPRIHQFVIFSSVSCGRGNAGQSNYGMANSVMERIIEKRHENGLCAKAVQWGAVGEVGLVADMQEDKLDMEIGGTLQQRISSCLQELDPLLTDEYPIVASMVVAEKRHKGGAEATVIDAVMNIMAIRDIKTVSLDTTLSDLGMDSLMAVEIKQTLEREYEIMLTPQDLRSMTFQRLHELAAARKDQEMSEEILVKETVVDMRIAGGQAILLRNYGDEETAYERMLRLHSKDENNNYHTAAIIVPGVEGVCGTAYRTLASQLNASTFILQLMDTAEMTNLAEITETVFNDVYQVFQNVENFYLIGYSFGALLTLELARMLEERGKPGHVLIIDGSPAFLKQMVIDSTAKGQTDADVEDTIIRIAVMTLFPDDHSETIKTILALPTWDERVDKLTELAKPYHSYSDEYAKLMANALFTRVKIALHNDVTKIKPIRSGITLVRPTEMSVIDIEEDYGLAAYTEGKFNMKFLEGNHSTVIDNPKMAVIINESDPAATSDKDFVKSVLLELNEG